MDELTIPTYPLLSYHASLYFASRILKLKVKELQHLCKSFGIASFGTKTCLQTRILHAFQANSCNNSSILAIDIGIKNLAFIDISFHDNKPWIKRWELLNLDLPAKFAPVEYASLLNSIVSCKFNHLSNTTVLIERQSWRRFIPQTILKSVTVESMLIAILLYKAAHQKSVVVESILPKTVSDFYEIHKSQLNTTKTKQSNSSVYKQKKTNTIEIVKQALNANERDGIQCPDEFIQYFHSKKKKDDLSDCFLMAMAYIEWKKNMNEYLITKKV